MKSNDKHWAQCTSSMTPRSPPMSLPRALGSPALAIWRPSQSANNRPRSLCVRVPSGCASLHVQVHLLFLGTEGLCTCVICDPLQCTREREHQPGSGPGAVAAASGGPALRVLQKGVWVPGGHCSLEWGAPRGRPKWGAIKFGAQNWGSRCPGLRSNTDFGNVRQVSRISGSWG